jgi:hypothetical protein
MISPQEAEALAQVTVETFVSCCGAADADDARRAVIKLFSMAGIALVAIAGRERALEILDETKQNMSRTDLVARLEMVKKH